jgi:phosphinothricin acetyltransferase
MKFSIEPMKSADWPAVREIYSEGIATGDATFETEPPDQDEWNRSHLEKCRLVVRDGGSVLGWAALSPVTDRCAYRGVAEISIYIRESARGRGVGTALLRSLVEESERQGIWTVQAGIFPENDSSIRLHEACGFRRVGIRKKLGKLGGVWRDVMLMERRSEVVGN